MYGGRSYNHSHHHHHHYPNHHHKGAPQNAGVPLSPESAHATEIFDQFIAASTFKSVLHYYRYMCDVLRLRPQNIRHFYPKLKSKIHSWKAQALWSKFDKRASHKCYSHGKACTNTKILIIGAGPCGLRSAIEAQLLGAKVVVVEKRDRFSRNNVLHLWPFVIADLKALGAKKFYGKFCAGAIDHISIRQLQCMLLKVALLLGVEVYEGVGFEELLEPPEDQLIAWHARFSPLEHPVNQYEFDVLIGADGKRNTLMGFKRKEFRGKLAIAITANFINKHTEQEARVQEISGVAFIFNQKFFKDLYAETGIDLENIVYYKDETHYFVMTAKKHSLIDKGVILRDLPDTQQLLHPNNVDRKALCDYAREAADFSTGYQMPHLDFAVNHYGKPDIAMFDFTSMFAAENACRVVEKKGHKLLQCLVGDSLVEPFWPTGSGCARGFLSSFDACWAVRSWASGKMTPLEVVAERESIYRLLAQTTPENLSKDYSSYTLEPSSRYPTVNLKVLLPFQVRHLHLTDEPDKVDGDPDEGVAEGIEAGEDLPRKRKRRDSLIQPDSLLSWCQKQVAHNRDLNVEDLGSSFKDGRVLCTILHRYRPDLIDLENLNPTEHAQNAQLAFELLEREFGIPPVMTGDELTNGEIQEAPDLLGYIAQIHDALRGEIPHSMGSRPPLKALKGQTLEDLDLGDFPNHPKEKEVQQLFTESNLSSTSISNVQTNGRVSCRLLEEPKPETLSIDDLQKKKKRRNEFGSLDKLNEGGDITSGPKLKGLNDNSDGFSDRVKELEAKFRGNESVGGRGVSIHHKPKDLIRAVGRLEKSDWNLSAIEKKIEENSKPMNSTGAKKERVPNWSRDSYTDKFQNIERRLRENGEDEERIAKYLDIDASLKRLERKLREGSTLDTGLRGHNKVSDLALQLSSKLVRNEEGSTSKANTASKQARTMVLPTSGSDLCYFCGTRVYLVERLSAEGKFFHRHCFKCSYCGALLRLGNYIYDRENRYGGKFFCIPHFGLTVRSRGPKKSETVILQKPSEGELLRDNIFSKGDIKGGLSPFTIPSTETRLIPKGGEAKGKAHLLSPPCKGALSLDRGTTPERVEFENSVIEHSDEDEYLSEDEWTDRNFGASANELDEDDDSDDYSDLSDEVVDEEALLLETSRKKLTAAETRRLAESWKRRYSNDIFNITDEEPDESFSESENEDISEHGAEGDQSHTPTEDEIGDHADDDDDEGDDVRRARELRRLELNINVEAPPGNAETSDSGSETEVGSEDESDTQIDTDSEFADDREMSRLPNEIPTIVIDEMPKETKDEASDVPIKLLNPTFSPVLSKNLPSCEKEDTKVTNEIDTKNEKNGAEKSASMSNLLQQENILNPRTEQLRRLLQRTESTEVVSAQRNHLRRQYLLGNPSYSPKKSVSTADLGDRFKSFMDKISETQKKLNPAPQPSPAMQAFLNLSSKSNESNSPSLSPSRHQTFNCVSDPKEVMPPKLVGRDENRLLIKEELLIKSGSGESSDSSSKSEEGKLITFPSIFTHETKLTKNNQSSSSPSEYDNVNSKPHEDSTTPLEEKGTLDSEQSERSNLKKHLENAIGTELCPENETLPLIEAFNIPCLDKSQNVVEALNIEIISTENLKNAPSIDSSLICNSPKVLADDDTVEEVFDQLANDALIEFQHSDAASSFDQLDEAFVERNENDVNENNMNKSNMAEIPHDNTKLHYEINHSAILNDKKQDESGFKSLEETRSSLSLETNGVDLIAQNVKKETAEVLPNIDQNIVTTPEAVTTEADLSDWGDDNEMFAINADDFEMEFPTGQVPIKNATQVSYPPPSCLPELDRPVRPIARIASLESLGDSDSAISISMSKLPLPSLSHTPSFTADEKIEYVDNSASDSSQEDPPSVSIRYNPLQDCTPTSPSPPSKELIFNSTECCSVDKPRDLKCNLTSLKSRSVDTDETLNQVMPPRSSSEPFSLTEQILKVAPISSSESDDSSSSDSLQSSSQLKYDEFTPSFKQRKVPFVMARDSIDVRKESITKPLFTPSKEDILQRQKNEADRIANESTPLSPLRIPSGDSSIEAPPISGQRARGRNSLAKDGDLVREMVMSRISKSNETKAQRRGSRNTLHTSSSSLFNSEPTLLFDSSAGSKSSPLVCNTEESVTTPSPTTIIPPTVQTQSLSSFKLASTENVPSKVAKCENILSPTNQLPNNLSLSLQKITIFNTPSSKKIECSTSKNVLPATPLTHPEKFQKEDSVKRELFKSSPQLHVSHISSTPRLTNPSYLANPQNHMESPLINDQNASLSQSLVKSTKESPTIEGVLKFSASEAKAKIDLKDTLPQPTVRKEDTERFPKKHPDERLKELIEERRRKEVSEPREVRLRKKDSSLQGCLEEYRQKRSSAPVFTQTTLDIKAKPESNSQTRAQLGLPPPRHFHRPSLLELESMHIFSPSRATREASPSSISGATPPLSPITKDYCPSNSPKSPEKTPSGGSEKKPTKKSKDRERRRSLIQVVAGMFSKSDEKKKESNESEINCGKLSLPPTPPAKGLPPKSPSVKERFSKLRLSRTKEKKKSPSDIKIRSASVDVPCSDRPPEGKEGPSLTTSMPTSPSRTIFSFLSSSPLKPDLKSKASTTGSSSSYFSQRFSPSCIKEEHNSDEESGQLEVVSPNKDSPPSTAIPTLRRQKAALRVAKQAEQKRLRMAQEIQRQLEECDVKMRDLEERGVGVEKALIGETEGTARDETELTKEWFSLVHEKNSLVRWQEELTVKARELELEDTHVRLENELRQRMTSAEREKTREDIEREGKILAEIISIIEQKDALVNLLEEDRQRCAKGVSLPTKFSIQEHMNFPPSSLSAPPSPSSLITSRCAHPPHPAMQRLFSLTSPFVDPIPLDLKHLAQAPYPPFLTLSLSRDTLKSYQGVSHSFSLVSRKRNPVSVSTKFSSITLGSDANQYTTQKTTDRGKKNRKQIFYPSKVITRNIILLILVSCTLVLMFSAILFLITEIGIVHKSVAF